MLIGAFPLLTRRTLTGRPSAKQTHAHSDGSPVDTLKVLIGATRTYGKGTNQIRRLESNDYSRVPTDQRKQINISKMSNILC